MDYHINNFYINNIVFGQLYYFYLFIYNMNTGLNNEVINDEPFSFYSLITYFKENIIGLSLLLFTVLIVIIVDYISRINSIMFSPPNPLNLPGFQQIKTYKQSKMRKFRKQ